ncbi:MAG TPA: universal stress protein [Euryarchaeota archaeon]|nr:stress response protein NhaX [archaeon BMS3Bbin15]HDL14728.1 universal stress protein [Euryarchaeota archaeon]
MIKKILLATDGSAFSEKAGKYAIYLGKKLEAEVTALHVIELKPPRFLSPEDIDRQKAVMAKDCFNVLKKRAENKCVKLSTLILVSRSTARSILDESEDGYDLIVMGSLGKTGLKKLLLGSVSEEVVRKASIPVMVIH